MPHLNCFHFFRHCFGIRTCFSPKWDNWNWHFGNQHLMRWSIYYRDNAWRCSFENSLQIYDHYIEGLPIVNLILIQWKWLFEIYLPIYNCVTRFLRCIKESLFVFPRCFHTHINWKLILNGILEKIMLMLIRLFQLEVIVRFSYPSVRRYKKKCFTP